MLFCMAAICSALRAHKRTEWRDAKAMAIAVPQAPAPKTLIRNYQPQTWFDLIKPCCPSRCLTLIQSVALMFDTAVGAAFGDAVGLSVTEGAVDDEGLAEAVAGEAGIKVRMTSRSASKTRGARSSAAVRICARCAVTISCRELPKYFFSIQARVPWLSRTFIQPSTLMTRSTGVPG